MPATGCQLSEMAPVGEATTCRSAGAGGLRPMYDTKAIGAKPGANEAAVPATQLPSVEIPATLDNSRNGACVNNPLSTRTSNRFKAPVEGVQTSVASTLAPPNRGLVLVRLLPTITVPSAEMPVGTSPTSSPVAGLNALRPVIPPLRVPMNA